MPADSAAKIKHSHKRTATPIGVAVVSYSPRSCFLASCSSGEITSLSNRSLYFLGDGVLRVLTIDQQPSYFGCDSILSGQIQKSDLAGSGRYGNAIGKKGGGCYRGDRIQRQVNSPTECVSARDPLVCDDDGTAGGNPAGKASGKCRDNCEYEPGFGVGTVSDHRIFCQDQKDNGYQ